MNDEQKTRINEIVSQINDMLSRVKKGVVYATESEPFFHEHLRSALSLFDNTSDEWRIIDRWTKDNGYNWSNMQKSGYYAGKDQEEKLEKLADALSNLVGAVSNKQDKAEWHFTSKDAYDAKRLICDIFRLAGNKIIVIDSHLDDRFFDFVDIVPDTVRVQIITGEDKPVFWNLLAELKTKRQNIEARINNVSHCRYIIVDDAIIYSTDASLNTIGKKDFMIHKLQDSAQISKVMQEVYQYWNNAKIKKV